MARKYWIILGVLTVLAVLGAAAAGVGYWQYREYQVRTWLAEGTAAYEAGDWREAKKNFRMYLARNTTDQDILLKYADATSQVAHNRPVIQADLARAYYQLADAYPENDEFLRKLMEVESNRGSWTDLEYYSTFFLYDRPDDPMLSYYHAYALDRLGQADEAIAEYEALIERGDVYREEVYGYLARLYAQQNRETEAQQVFEDALEKHPGDAEIVAQYALHFMRANRDAHADSRIVKALELAPESGLVRFAAAQVAMDRADWDSAIAHAEKAIDAGYAEPQVYVLLADALQFAGRIEDAIALIDGLDPLFVADHSEFYLMYAELLFRAERFEAAKEWAGEYRKIYPNHRVAHDYLDSRFLLAEGNAAAAATKLTTVVKTSPSFRQASLYLIAAHLQLQDRSTAKSELEVYMANFPNDSQAQELYQREFGGVATLSSAVNNAEAVLAQEDATAEMLLAAATELYNKSAAANAKDEHMALLIRLARQAIELAPQEDGGYAVLAEIYANTDRADQADVVIHEAQQAGVNLDDLRMVRAIIAGAKSDEETAFALYTEELDEGSATVDDIIRWASYFARKFSIDAGNRAFELGKERVPAETQPVLTLEQLDMMQGTGKPKELLALLNTMEQDETLPSDVAESLVERKKDIVRELLQPGENYDRATAEALYDELLEKRPSDLSVRLLEAHFLLDGEDRDVEAARAVVEDVLASDPFNEEGLVMAARISEQTGEVGRALNYLEQAVNTGTATAQEYRSLARLQLAMDRQNDAIASLERALQLRPDDPATLKLLIESLQSAGRVARALSLLEDLEAVAPDTPETARILKLLRARLNLAGGRDLATAEASLREAFLKNPQDLRLVSDLARVITEQGRVAEAGTFLESYIEDNDNVPGAWVLLAQHYLTLPSGPDFAKAQYAATQATIVDKDYLPGIRTLIDICLRTNSHHQALALCDRYLALSPTSPAVLHQKGRLLTLRGDFAGAVDALDKSLAIETSPEKLEARGDAYAAMARYQEAINDYLEASRISGSTSSRVYLGLADSYMGLGELDRAREYLAQLNGRLALNDPMRQEARYQRLIEQLETGP